MTHGDDQNLRSRLLALSWKSWLILAVAMSAIGSLLAMAGLLVIHLYYVGDLKGAIANPFFFPSLLEQLTGIFLLSLTTNLCGALALMVFFAVRKRVRRA